MLTPSSKSRHPYMHLFLGCIATLMIVSAIAIIWSVSGTWQPIIAEVRETSIESTRPGAPAWSLVVDFDYEVDGALYQKHQVDVFHDSARGVTEEEQREWPAGKQFTIYCNQRHPSRFSLDPGFGAARVLAVLLICMAAAVMTPTFIAWLNRSQKRRA